MLWILRKRNAMYFVFIFFIMDNTVNKSEFFSTIYELYVLGAHGEATVYEHVEKVGVLFF